jgi:hypothetical protein
MPLRLLLLLATLHGASHQDTLRFAATFPQRIETEVCGQPALSTTVASAVEGALHSHVRGAPDLDLTFDTPAGQALFPHQRATFFVRVMATAPDRVQVQGNVAVTVINSGATIGHEPLLWFCNKP